MKAASIWRTTGNDWKDFLQEDHLKLFGRDFVERIGNWPVTRSIADGVTDKRRAEIGVRAGKAPFFILEKRAGE